MLGGKHRKSCSAFADRPAGVFLKAPEIRETECWGWAWGRTAASPGTDSRGRMSSDARVGHEIASNHTVRRLFPSQFSRRISVSVSCVQEEVQLAAHTFNTSLARGSSPL